MNEVLGAILSCGLIPVIRSSSAEEAAAVARGLRDGGVPCLEITFTVPGALGVIETLAREKALVGAGTVLDGETARAAILAGARFIVAPTVHPGTIRMARRHGVPVIPGAMTPTEALAAVEAGADLVKIFPANLLGGPAYLKALKAPFPNLPLVPTGGVSLENAGAYIEAGAAALGVGGELLDRKLLAARDYGALAARARAFLEAIRKARQAS